MLEPRILSRLAYFVAVAETGAFTRAAERMGVTKAVVSQQVARLEGDLGASLFVRTTRRVELTTAGRRLYERASLVLQDMQSAVEETVQINVSPQGVLRVVAPADYGAIMIVPAVAQFLRDYPQCSADISLSDRIVDVIAGEIDVSIRVGWLADSSLHARRIGSFEQLLVAGPTWADALHRVATPDQLSALPLIANTALPAPFNLAFTGPSGQEALFTGPASLAVDTTRGVHAALSAGAGMGVLPDFVADQDVADGRLVRVLPEWRLPSGGVYAVFPTGRHRPPRVSAFIHVLLTAIRSQ